MRNYLRMACFLLVLGLFSCGDNKPTVSANTENLNIAIQGGDEKTAKRFLYAMPSLANAGNKDGDMPLHFAARAGRISMVMLLLENNCDPTIPNKKKMLPIHIAAQLGKQDIYDVLLPRITDSKQRLLLFNIGIAKASGDQLEMEEAYQKVLRDTEQDLQRAKDKKDFGK